LTGRENRQQIWGNRTKWLGCQGMGLFSDLVFDKKGVLVDGLVFSIRFKKNWVLFN
jgi:hypothetical protein